MRIGVPGLCAVLLLGLWGQPAAAQRVPGGSYLGSCGDVGARGDRLVATCRRPDGSELRSELRHFHRCVGDIGNNNGILQCAVPGGQEFGQVIGPPAAPYGAPPPAYGPREQYGAHWERCRRLRERADNLRYRLDQTWEPGERARIEYRLRETRDQLRYERCRD